MNENLYDQILLHIKEGNKLNFSFSCFNGQAGIEVDIYDSKISLELKEIFTHWLYEGFYDLLVSLELYNGGDFDFFISNDELKIRGRSSLNDIDWYSDPEQDHKIEKILDRNVLEVLFKKDPESRIDIKSIILNFECEFDYLSDKTNFKMLDSAYYNEDQEYIKLDFSTIDMKVLEDLICKRIKDFNNDDIQPDIEYNHDYKSISCQDSRIQVNDHISFELKIEKTDPNEDLEPGTLIPNASGVIPSNIKESDRKIGRDENLSNPLEGMEQGEGGYVGTFNFPKKDPEPSNKKNKEDEKI